MTIQELLEYGKSKLKTCNKKEINFITKRLLAYFIKKDFTYISTYPENKVNTEIEEMYSNAIEKICKDIPLQYIIKQQSFMGIDFYVDENVLIPRPDTEILVEEVIEIAKRDQKNKILDMCTGSGAISVSIAKYLPKTEVIGTDISEKALKIAKMNAKNEEVNVKYIKSNLFENIYEKFDIIVSNPPYVRTEVIKDLDNEVKKEPFIALNGGKDGLYFYRKIIKKARNYLNCNGYLAVEIGYDQKKEVYKLFEEEKFTNIYSKKDYSSNDRIIVGKYSK